MPTQGERQDFLWRPNDNSSTTRLRYDLEAEHWYRSFKSAEMKHQSVSFNQSISVITLLMNLVLSFMILIVLLLIDVFKWVRSWNK
ncbi:hypothetical protein [Aestuariivivens sediminicola]|uniref:hypothetical protein n=1 Tax=Aestuariivivens sediminicola TaxID=2913560 RepID=UPI001F59C346|nr:hypothetical protein [Aestuariivivens sediminicola]